MEKTTKKGMKDKARNMLKRGNSKAGKVKNVKNVSSNLELEPGNELVMCAKLSIVTLKSYPKDMEKYLEITKWVLENYSPTIVMDLGWFVSWFCQTS